MRWLVIAMILAYKRVLSPWKGFACAYRVRTGRESCSTLGLRSVRRFGVVKGLLVLRERTHRCGVAFRRSHQQLGRPPISQRGDCDLGCSAPCDAGCDLPSGKSLSWVGDCASCDWSHSKRRKSDERENYVYLPPDVRLPP